MFVTEARENAKESLMATKILLGSSLTLVSSYYDVKYDGQNVVTRWFIPGASGTIEVVPTDAQSNTTTVVIPVAAGVRYPVSFSRIKSGSGTTVPINGTLVLGL